jgi:hypothetical protein
MKSALVIYYTTVIVVVVVGIALVGAVSIIGPNIPAAYANDNQFCTHIQEYDEDGTPTIGSDCKGKMKYCRNDSQGLDKCVKDDKFVYP